MNIIEQATTFFFFLRILIWWNFWPKPFCWIRVGIDSLLSSISVLSTDRKRIQLNTDYSGVSEQINLLNPLVRQQSSKLNPSLSPCRSSGKHSWRLFQRTIKGFDCKINSRALGAVLRHTLGWSDGLAQTQGVSKSAAVAAGSDLLTWKQCSDQLDKLLFFIWLSNLPL